VLPVAPAIKRLRFLRLLPEAGDVEPPTMSASDPPPASAPEPPATNRKRKIAEWLPDLYVKHPPLPTESRTAWANRVRKYAPQSVAAHSIVSALPAALESLGVKWAGLEKSPPPSRKI
jgi:hypothetical protein